jgi:hypothetical protein
MTPRISRQAPGSASGWPSTTPSDTWEEGLGSLLRQSCDNFELVISDNAFYLLQGSENGDHDTSMPIHSRSLAARDC